PARDYPDGPFLPKSFRNAFGARGCCAGACVTARWGRTRSAQLLGHCPGTRWGVFGSWAGALVDRNVILEHGSGRSRDILVPRKQTKHAQPPKIPRDGHPRAHPVPAHLLVHGPLRPGFLLLSSTDPPRCVGTHTPGGLGRCPFALRG